jgi:hypothetical protein
MLPQSPEEIDTKFYVFSTKNRFASADGLRNAEVAKICLNFQVRQSIPSILVPRHLIVFVAQRDTHNDHASSVESTHG